MRPTGARSWPRQSPEGSCRSGPAHCTRNSPLSCRTLCRRTSGRSCQRNCWRSQRPYESCRPPHPASRRRSRSAWRYGDSPRAGAGSLGRDGPPDPLAGRGVVAGELQVSPAFAGLSPRPSGRGACSCVSLPCPTLVPARLTAQTHGRIVGRKSSCGSSPAALNSARSQSAAPSLSPAMPACPTDGDPGRGCRSAP